MIGWHCGKRVLHEQESRLAFTVRCAVCGRLFTQRKRGKPSITQSTAAPVPKR